MADDNKVNAPVTNGNFFQLPVVPRPILSSMDTYDQNTQVEDYSDAFATGRRPLWNVPDLAYVNSKVTTIKSSASVTSASPAIATKAGILQNPATALTTFTVVPNLGQVIKASGPVQVSFAVNVSTLNANDPVSFAIFRCGTQVGQTFQGSAGAANTAFNVIASYTDNPPLGNHVYDVRWKKGSSTATAIGTQRTIQVLNLRAQ